jgi:hypothetical protein
MDRFQSLWRVEVFVREDVKEDFDQSLPSSLEEGIKLLLLGVTEDGAQPDNLVFDLAKRLAVLPGKFHGRKVSELAAAKGTPTRHPMGAPLLKSFFTK